MIYKDDDEMEERSLARDVPRSGQLTMSWGGGGADCSKVVVYWGKMNTYGNLPSSRVMNICFSLRVWCNQGN